MLSLLPILLMQAATPAPPATEAADARCIFVYGFIGSRGTPAQAEQAKLATMYFVGKLRGRNPAVDIGKLLSAAGDEAKRLGLSAQAEGSRCENEIRAAGTALVNGSIAAKTVP